MLWQIATCCSPGHGLHSELYMTAGCIARQAQAFSWGYMRLCVCLIWQLCSASGCGPWHETVSRKGLLVAFTDAWCSLPSVPGHCHHLHGFHCPPAGWFEEQASAHIRNRQNLNDSQSYGCVTDVMGVAYFYCKLPALLE